MSWLHFKCEVNRKIGECDRVCKDKKRGNKAPDLSVIISLLFLLLWAEKKKYTYKYIDVFPMLFLFVFFQREKSSSYIVSCDELLPTSITIQ